LKTDPKLTSWLFLSSQVNWAGGSALASQLRLEIPEMNPKNSPRCSAGHSGSSVE
jgi:hypothetical protein